MRIAVLAYNLWSAGGLSVGRNFVSSLQRVADAHDYLISMPTGVGYEALRLPARTTTHWLDRAGQGTSRLARFELTELPRLVNAFRPDVILGLGNVGLVRPPAPQAVLIHNPHLVYRVHNRRAPRSILAAARAWISHVRIRRALANTQLVFTQTSVMADRVRRELKFRGRVALMPNAVSESAIGGNATAPPPPAAIEKLAGRRPFFCLTRYYPHKNLEVLVDVFRAYGSQLRDTGVIFTVAADQGAHAARMLAELESPGLRDALVSVGALSQSELAAYYQHSAGLILPTLLESFSGTYLEAMQFQRPILTSDLDFARCVCGDAALYFDPHDPASIRDAMRRVIDDAAVRDELVQRGTARRATFVRSWDSIVADAVGELERLAGERQSERSR